jgi:hypothetical protein
LEQLFQPFWISLQSSLEEWRAVKPPARDVGVPPDRNPRFSDRVTDLERLDEELASTRRVDLAGLAGIAAHYVSFSIGVGK